MTKNGQDCTESQLRSLAYQTIESIVQPLLGKLQTELSSVFEELKQDEDSPPTKNSTCPPERDITQLVKLSSAEYLAVNELYERGILTWANFQNAVVSGGIDAEQFPDVVSNLTVWGLIVRTSMAGGPSYQLTRLGQSYLDILEEILDEAHLDAE